MATIVNNPPDTDSGSGMGFVFGMILLIVFLFLFIAYGVPVIRNSMGGTSGGSQINVNPPSDGQGVNIPDKINGSLDVNVNQKK